MGKNKEPRVLFKYRHFDSAGYHLKSLEEMYFTPPEKFNDPFDTALPVLYHSSNSTPDQILEHMRRQNSVLFSPPRPDSQIVQDWKKFIEKISINLIEAQAIDQKQAETNAKETGAFSLAAQESNILMWSHYGLNHSGFCIGYRTNVLYEALRSHAQVVLTPIEYHKECPVINPYDPNLSIDDWFGPFKVKHSDWAYEKEWRLILLKGASEIIPIPENAIESIYLGMRISKADEELLLNKIRSRKYPVDLFRARPKFNCFDLTFEKERY